MKKFGNYIVIQSDQNYFKNYQKISWLMQMKELLKLLWVYDIAA